MVKPDLAGYLNLEPVSRHGRLDDDEFIWAELDDVAEALGWSATDRDLVANGPTQDGSYGTDGYCVRSDAPNWVIQEAEDDANEAEQQRYDDLISEAITFRRLERERDTWRFDAVIEQQSTFGTGIAHQSCRWVTATYAVRGRAPRRGRRVVRVASGPPGRPRPASGDDDPPPPDLDAPDPLAERRAS